MSKTPTGTASLTRGKWIARITLHREARLPTGRFPRASVPVTREAKPVTKDYAKAFAKRLQQRYDEGSWKPDGAKQAAPYSVAEWVAQWLSEQSYGEVLKDRARTSLWLKRVSLGRLALHKVTPLDAAALVSELRAARTKTGTQLAPRTVRNIVDPIARALRGAVFVGHLQSDPFASLPTSMRPQAVDANPEWRAGRCFSKDQVLKLLECSEIDPRWRTLWTLLVLTGARVSEAIALRWNDTAAVHPLWRLTISGQINYKSRERVPTKTRSVAEVPVHPYLRSVLEWWSLHGWSETYGRLPRDEDFLIPTLGAPGRPGEAPAGAGGPLWRHDVLRAFHAGLAAAGLPKRRVHDLRATFVTFCAGARASEAIAQRWTHAPSSPTARHLYLVPPWEDQCAEMSRIEMPAPWTSKLKG